MTTLRFVTIEKFHDLTGYTAMATRSKIARGDWMQDREYIKAPDGRILMDLKGYETWATSGGIRACGRSQTDRLRSTSDTGACAAASG